MKTPKNIKQAITICLIAILASPHITGGPCNRSPANTLEDASSCFFAKDDDDCENSVYQDWHISCKDDPVVVDGCELDLVDNQNVTVIPMFGHCEEGVCNSDFPGEPYQVEVNFRYTTDPNCP